MATDNTLDWHALRHYTGARVALRRVGASLSTAEVLEFSMAHARARDAVHVPLDVQELREQLQKAGFPAVLAQSQARDRSEYLRRPDLGRRLEPGLRENLRDAAAPARRLTIVLADGLSACATKRHAVPLLQHLRPVLADWLLDTVVIAQQARVALGDEIGQLRGAEAQAILIGERPGLSAPDSLGIYLTYRPKLGRTDAERNCISNVRAGGLSYEEAAFRLSYLLNQARLMGMSGIPVKDLSVWNDSAPPLKTCD